MTTISLLRTIASMALFGAWLLAGCASTVDVTKYKNNICEVHQLVMTVHEVECVSGNSCYMPDFRSAMHEQFPHHGWRRYSEDHFVLHARRLRDYVCPECTKAYEDWVARNPRKVASQGSAAAHANAQ